MDKVFPILIMGIVFGFSGFIVETVNNLFKTKRLKYMGDKLFWGIPILPIYSIGGLLMHFVIKNFASYPWYQVVLIDWSVVCWWEYISGYFCHKILGKQYWNYSKKKYNFNGYICGESVVWWLIFVIVYYFFLFGPVNRQLGY